MIMACELEVSCEFEGKSATVFAYGARGSGKTYAIQVGLLNVDGYYNSLLTFIDKAVDDGFIKPSQRHIFVSATTAKELVLKLEEYVPVHGELEKSSWEVDQQEQQQVVVGFNAPTPFQNPEDILEDVLPFDLLPDRQKRINFHSNLNKFRNNQRKEKIIRDAGIAVASLAACEEALERELLISTSYVHGMEVTLSSRLKSLYSIYSKMKRKDVAISKVYDARALRIVVGDKDGTLLL